VPDTAIRFFPNPYTIERILTRSIDNICKMFTTSRFSSCRIAAVPAIAGLTALTACGGTSTDASEGSTDVATLESSDGLGDVQTSEATRDATLTADEAALEFSACLRDQGLDVPDIGVDADGNVQVRDAFENIDRGDESFRDALQSCNEILADAGFGGGGGGPGGGIRDNVEVQDAFVALTDCVREQGFEEATEITLGQPGGGQAGGGQEAGDGAPDGGQRGQGENQGPGAGDRTNRLATQMGLDPEDLDVVAAMEVCSPILDEAFSAAGVEPRGGN
jgi:hypothetical protein